MADTKKGRDKKARDEEKRQRKREVEEERRRADEPEPDENLGDRLGEGEVTEVGDEIPEGAGEMPEDVDEILEEADELPSDMGEMPEEDLAGGDEELTVDQRERDDRDQQVGERGPDSPLGEIDDLLGERDYPVSAEELLAEHGRQEIEVVAGETTLEEVLLPEDDESFDSVEELRERIEDRLERG